MRIPLDEIRPTHTPAVVCEECGGDDALRLDGDRFVCRGPHTHHRKSPIPSPYRARLKEVQ